MGYAYVHCYFGLWARVSHGDVVHDLTCHENLEDLGNPPFCSDVGTQWHVAAGGKGGRCVNKSGNCEWCTGQSHMLMY